ncbi:hypothetical protein [Desulfobulbus oligotrophicus]|jgi:hypothetical protein|uniref:Lipoprotein n=1 Tax=Desulfobulbus oligotrophicus TaxID=1909699 RepID=A0A7T5VET5_9BACT|nr:hypothetical protein [Desulfobulbus oligotrophicus]MDY0389777.1 hypothetical protein [Desulfobulbus oligotrophicus]QQG66582.1 hypothetical protein HP555_12235 [Desulfobulbus oligotrophicus]
MKRICRLAVFAIAALALAGCGAATIAPNYHSTDPELMRVGGDMPGQKEPEIINMGSYCLKVVDTWKSEGQTPDGQPIWTKDSFRNVVPCR